MKETVNVTYELYNKPYCIKLMEEFYDLNKPSRHFNNKKGFLKFKDGKITEDNNFDFSFILNGQSDLNDHKGDSVRLVIKLDDFIEMLQDEQFKSYLSYANIRV